MAAEGTSTIDLLRQLADSDDVIVKIWGIIQANYFAFGGMEKPSAFFKAVEHVLLKIVESPAAGGAEKFKIAALGHFTQLGGLFSDLVGLFTDLDKALQSRRALQDFIQHCVLVYRDDLVRTVRSVYKDENPLKEAPILPRARQLNIFAGSLMEGSWTVRCLTEGELEVDLMALIGELKPDVSRKIIDSSQSPPGFCRLRMPDSVEDVVNHFRHLRTDQRAEKLKKIIRPENKFISSKDVKRGYRLWLDESQYKPFPAIPEPETKTSGNTNPDVIRPPIEAGCGNGTLFQITGKSFLEEHGEQSLVTLPPDCDLQIVADLVPCVKLQEWPALAQEWKERERLWPPKDVVDEIVEAGCHLVVKSPKQPDETATVSADDYQWRFSFSIAEFRLADLRSTHQCFVYFLLKYLFYRELKTLECNGSRLSSYVVKTVMMWAMEEAAASEWGRSDSDPLPDLTRLLAKLARHLKTKVMPNYFMPDANLLAFVPDELLNQAFERTHQMAADPLTFLSKEVPTTSDVMMKIVKTLW